MKRLLSVRIFNDMIYVLFIFRILSPYFFVGGSSVIRVSVITVITVVKAKIALIVWLLSISLSFALPFIAFMYSYFERVMHGAGDIKDVSVCWSYSW